VRGPSLIEFPLPHDRSLTVVGSRNGKYRAHHAGPSVAHKPQLRSLPDVYKPTTNPLSHATNAMSSNVGPIDRHRQVRHSDAGCVWVAAICRETPSAANSLIGIVRFLRRSDRPSATLNLRVGGSIPPRLTTHIFHRKPLSPEPSRSLAQARMRLGCGIIWGVRPVDEFASDALLDG
jgi:hypothetical protein